MPTTKLYSGQQLFISNDLDFNTKKGINLVDPVNPQDAATKAYVDSIVSTGTNKGSARVASTANVTLTAPGTTIDGVTLSNGDLVLLKDQTTASQNGLYVFNGSATTMTRAVAADTSAEVKSGMFVFVSEGTANGDNGYTLTTNDPIVLGTTSLVFTQTSGAGQITSGAGLTKTGNTLDVGTASASRIVVNADNIDLATTAVTAGTVGDAGFNVSQITVDAYGRLTSATNRDMFGTTLSANTVFAAPNGSAGAPAFRLLVAADIPNHDANKITTGTLLAARGGTGVDGSAAANGSLLIGNGTGFSLATLTQGSGITITNASGAITIAASGGLSATNFVTNEVPSGTVNGSNATFTLANTPTAGTERISVGGARMRPGAGNDYTISGATITFLTGAIPQTGQNVLADYMK